MNCPVCGDDNLTTLIEVHGIPVHSVQLIHSREQALNYPKGDLVLTHCEQCHFIFNSAFDESLLDYSEVHESTQIHSRTFQLFHEKLALQLLEKYNLRRKKLLEIGCGQGEFLTLLCDLGDNQGIGFDPAYRPSSYRNESVQVETRCYPSGHETEDLDFLCCRMTLEHVPNARSFVQNIANSIRHNTTVFFQVPNAERILRDVALYDVYYEHCSYFSTASLCRLFQICGLEVTATDITYNDQYLTIDARPVQTESERRERWYHPESVSNVSTFPQRWKTIISQWRKLLNQWQFAGERTVLWGGGSKAVAFCTNLEIDREIDFVVDINPMKHDTYLAGSGHEVVSPQALIQREPDRVILMNPIYRDEVADQLQQMGITTHFMSVDSISEHIR